jgi:hypothetical protein
MPTTKWVIRRPDGKYISPPDCAVWDTEAEVIEAIAKAIAKAIARKTAKTA